MPTYTLRCKSCGAVLKVFSKKQENLHCVCGGELERIYDTPPAVHFKGNGFYETDYKQKNKDK